jgi:hypothetical protein
MKTEAENAAEAARPTRKKNPGKTALVDRYIAQYPAAEAIRDQLIGKEMASGEVAAAVRKFMDEQIGA